MERIALTGPMYSGKTTIAKALHAQGYMLIVFSDLLKAEAVKALAACGRNTSVTAIHQGKKVFRPFLQELGVLLDFDTDPVWVHRALAPWIDAGCPPAVFDNPRTNEQAEALSDYGFKIVQVRISKSEQARRAYDHGVTLDELIRVQQHQIEQGIAHKYISLYLDGREPVQENIRFLLGEKELNSKAS